MEEHHINMGNFKKENKYRKNPHFSPTIPMYYDCLVLDHNLNQQLENKESVKSELVEYIDQVNHGTMSDVMQVIEGDMCPLKK